MRDNPLFFLTSHVSAALLFLVVSHFVPCEAAEFNVNSAEDVADLDPGNGLCVAYLTVIPPFVLPFCTLRAAIEETNALPGPDSINVPSGSYPLRLEGNNEDKSSTGDLDITDSLHIRGEGVNRTIVDGNGLDRIFDVLSPDIQVTIEDMAITNGSLPAFLLQDQKGGAGIRNRGNLALRNVLLENNLVKGSSTADSGGALNNQAECALAWSTVSGNHAAEGGGIYNAPGGSLTVFASTINGNSSLSGGGIRNEGGASIVNSTISGNRLTAAAYPSGGGVSNTGEMNILQSTITDNSSPVPGGGMYNGGWTWLTNTIVAGNASANCYPAQNVNSLGSNLDDDGSCMFDMEGDVAGISPRLGPLQDHGGPTRTHGLLIGSPAVDRGQDLSSLGISIDQRGLPRPDGEAFDIGAFETRKRSVVPLFSPLLCCGK